MKILSNIVNQRFKVFDIFHALTVELGTVSKFRALFQAAKIYNLTESLSFSFPPFKRLHN